MHGKKETKYYVLFKTESIENYEKIKIITTIS